MNKYVVAFCSLHSGELKQEIVEADTSFDAAVSYLGLDDEHILALNNEWVRLQDYVSDSDCFISVIEIQSNRRAGMSSLHSTLYGQIPQGEVANH